MSPRAAKARRSSSGGSWEAKRPHIALPSIAFNISGVSGRPVLRNCTLRRIEAQGPVADHSVQHILQLILLPCRPAVRRTSRLRPQVAPVRRRAAKRQRDEVIFLVVSHSLVGVAQSSKLSALQVAGEPTRRPHRACPTGNADRGGHCVRRHRRVNGAWRVGRIRAGALRKSRRRYRQQKESKAASNIQRL